MEVQSDLLLPYNYRGGSGDGAVTESLTGVSTIAGCAISNHFLTATGQNQGYCEVKVTKASSQNYLSESSTVQMYFMAFSNNQPTGLVGSGSTIAINGSTSYVVDTTAPPTITSISWVAGYTMMCPHIVGICNFPAHYEITGSGFGSYGSVVTIKFWRNKVATTGSVGSDGFVSSDSLIFLYALPVGTSAGRVAVITTNGEGVSSFTFTP